MSRHPNVEACLREVMAEVEVVVAQEQQLHQAELDAVRAELRGKAPRINQLRAEVAELKQELQDRAARDEERKRCLATLVEAEETAPEPLRPVKKERR